MSWPEDLPELSELIPSIQGAVYAYSGSTYLVPERIQDAKNAPDHGVVRCGFRLFEIDEWIPSHNGWKVKPFLPVLSDGDLETLARDPATDGMEDEDAEGEAT